MTSSGLRLPRRKSRSFSAPSMTQPARLRNQFLQARKLVRKSYSLGGTSHLRRASLQRMHLLVCPRNVMVTNRPSSKSPQQHRTPRPPWLLKGRHYCTTYSRCCMSSGRSFALLCLSNFYPLTQHCLRIRHPFSVYVTSFSAEGRKSGVRRRSSDGLYPRPVPRRAQIEDSSSQPERDYH